MKRVLLLLLGVAPCAPAQSLVVSDFSAFTPSAYSAAASGPWSSATASAGATAFTVANVGGGTPGGQAGNGFTTFLGSPQDWSGYGYATLTGTALPANATPSLYFYVEDEDGAVSASTRFDLALFAGADASVSVPIAFGGLDPTRVAHWGFVVSEAGNPAFAFAFDQIALTTAAIPEPASGALLLGGAAFACVLRRRRAPNRESRIRNRKFSS